MCVCVCVCVCKLYHVTVHLKLTQYGKSTIVQFCKEVADQLSFVAEPPSLTQQSEFLRP